MKNYISSGSPISVTAPYDRASGEGVKVGTLFGVATKSVLSGAALEIVTEGVVELNKLATDVVTQGLALYWDDASTPKRVTITATANLFIGHAVEAAGNGVATVKLRLSPSSKAVG